MKKIISLVLAVTLLFTMLFTSTFSADADNVVTTTKIDLTQDVANLFATTSSTTGTTATVEDGKLKVHVSAYERQLSSLSYSSQSWVPNYLLAVDGAVLKLTDLDRAIVEVKYKVTGTPNATHGTQIGIGNFNGGKGSNICLRTSKKHTSEDVGKEFILTSTFDVDGNYAIKIAFTGGGDIEISSIVVHELPAQNVSDYAVVKYVDGSDYNTEFAEKNAAPKTLDDGRKFEGWFANSDFSGEPVTTITEDTTLYGRFTYKTTQIDLTQDVANVFATTGNTTNTTATVEDGKLKVHVSAYERQLSSLSYASQSWVPNYLLAVDGAMLKLTNGNKAIVEVKYKVSGTISTDHGVSIGVGSFNGGNGSNIYLRTYKKHTSDDVDKEFTLTSVFVADGKYSTKIGFTGGGDIEISSIVVHELPQEYIDEYVAVKYVDVTEGPTEFTKKNTATKTPADDGRKFEGWYASSDFSGEAVTTITEDVTLYGRFTYKTTQIDLTQDVANVFATTSSTTGTTATVEDGKLKVHVSAYERQLSSLSYSSQSWVPNYLLAVDGSMLKLTSGNKAIVEVKYKVTGTPNATHGTQIGIGNFNGGNGSNIYLRTYRKHTADDVGKEFTLTSVFVADGKYSTKIGFTGGGDIEISSIVVHELPANYINEYAAVQYVDVTEGPTEFTKKNTATKTPADDGRKFEGWYASSDFSGEAVTTITEDVTLYGRFTYKTTAIDLTQDVASLFATTGNTTGTTATVENGKLKVHVSAYERQLSSLSYASQSWVPNYLLAVDGAMLKLTNGNKAIVEVKYKVTSTPNADHGVSIGVGNFNGGNGSNIYLRTYKKHTAGDVGKEFTLTSAFVADGKYSTKIGFTGGGDIEISSIVVYELPAEYIDEYAVVTYVEDTDETIEFAKINTAPKTPSEDPGMFAGWSTTSDFTGNIVTQITEDATLYAKPIIYKNVIDLTQDVTKVFATTGSTTATTATVENGKLKVHVSAYERQLSSLSYGTQSWVPNYLLAENGSMIKIKNGDKAIVEVKYKVTSTPNADHGVSIGAGNFNGGNGSNIYLRAYKKHTAADKGKEFTFTTNFVADGNYSTKIGFTGGGDIEISSIVLYELDSQYIDDYAVVKYVDGIDETNEFVKKNTALKTPSKESDMFVGWYSGSDFSGEAVTTVSGDATLYAKRVLIKNEIDLTQDVASLFATTGNTTGTTATVENGKLKVHISAYERQLSALSYDSVSWVPNYLLAVNGDYIKLANGNKAIAEVKYKVTSTPNADHGVSIGVGNFQGGNGSNIHLRNFNKHTAGDQGKEFTLTSVFVVDGKYSTKIAFTGGGDIEISSIVLYELDSQHIDDYAVLKCVDGDNSVTEFVKKNSKLTAKLSDTLGENFGGWYNGEEKVTTISGDVTATAKWHERFDANMDASTDVRDLVYISEAYDGLNNDSLCDVDRDKVISDADFVTLKKKLLEVEYVTIGGNAVSDYTLKTEEKPSFMTNASTKQLSDSFKETYGADLTANADNSIVVGILNTDEGVKTTAKENLTGVRGDVYGLDDYKIFFYEDDLYIEAGSDYATAFAINTFKGIVNENKIFPKGLEITGKYYGENSLFEGYSYVWGDEFKGDTLDTNKWTVKTGENPGPYYERTNSYYINSKLNGGYGGPWSDPDGNPNMQEGVVTLLNEEGNNYYVQDGLLVMNTKKTDTGYSATQINAKQSFTYGIMTARVKLATKNGACSTLWSRTADDGGASVNEMDFVENFGSDQVVPNLHTWVNYTEHTNHKGDIDKQDTITPANGESMSDSFHEVSLYWDEEKIVFYFDGVPYLEQDIASDKEKWEAFHKSTYMIMGISAPSGYYSTAAGGKNPGDYMGNLINSFSENYAIDYIRVFQK